MHGRRFTGWRVVRPHTCPSPYERTPSSRFGNAELRLPVARFPLLLPWHIGLLGYAESGRVFVAGDSPGVSVLLTNGRERQLIIGTGAA